MKTKFLIFSILLFHIYTIIAQDTASIRKSNKLINIKTNIFTPIIRGVEIEAELALSKKISIQLAGNEYNIGGSEFWYGEKSKCIIFEIRYFFFENRNVPGPLAMIKGLYLGPYSRYKMSAYSFGKTTSLNYGLTLGYELIIKKGFTINQFIALGTGKNLSLSPDSNYSPASYLDIIQKNNINHFRYGVSLGYTF